jgi:hypothetical protein
VLKVAVTNRGEPIWPSRTPKPLDQSEWEARIEAEGYRQLPQMRHRALELNVMTESANPYQRCSDRCAR